MYQPTNSDTLKSIYDTLNQLQTPFYEEVGFYVSLLGLILSGLAYYAAQGAKKAAQEAGKSVKIQTVAVELSEISIKLDRLNDSMTHSEVRDLLNEISRKIRRLISNISYITDDNFKSTSIKLIETLNKAKKALSNVTPATESIDKEAEQKSVYFAIEDYFSTINNEVADLIGILERKSLNIDD